MVQSNRKIAQEKMKFQHDKRCSHDNEKYQVNDLVKIINHTPRRGHSSAWEPKFLGPFKVVRIFSIEHDNITYEISDGISSRVVHYNRLEKFFSRANDTVILGRFPIYDNASNCDLASLKPTVDSWELNKLLLTKFTAKRRKEFLNRQPMDIPKVPTSGSEEESDTESEVVEEEGEEIESQESPNETTLNQLENSNQDVLNTATNLHENSSEGEFLSMLENDEVAVSNAQTNDVIERTSDPVGSGVGVPALVPRRAGLRSGAHKNKSPADTPIPQTKMKKTYLCQGCKKDYKGIRLHQKSCVLFLALNQGEREVVAHAQVNQEISQAQVTSVEEGPGRAQAGEDCNQDKL